jgi:uncharacterized protein
MVMQDNSAKTHVTKRRILCNMLPCLVSSAFYGEEQGASIASLENSSAKLRIKLLSSDFYHPDLLKTLERIALALERLSPPPSPHPDWAADFYLWQGARSQFQPIESAVSLDLSLLQGIDEPKTALLSNTQRFAKGKPANNALLWGARGTGKSSLIKSVHADVNRTNPIKLIEIHREDITTLPVLMGHLKTAPKRFLVFCDDLSFEGSDLSYKSLKAALEGGIEGRPANVLFYATSNRRHLMARDMIENERSTALHPSEAVEENVSLSDRFGLWLGFHAGSQQDYLDIVAAYAGYYTIKLPQKDLTRRALEWAASRGNRSGRTAWQFIQTLI